MDTKLLAKLKFKRYFAKYEYLDMELNETEYLFDIYRKNFIEEVGFTPPAPVVPPPSATAHDASGAPPATDASGGAPPSEAGAEAELSAETAYDGGVEHDPLLKKIYKVLSLKVHPDKGGDEAVFIEVKTAYNENNLFKLMTIASKLKIDVFDYIDEDLNIDLYEKNLSDIETKIANYKTRIAWVWAFADDAKKEKLKKMVAASNA